MVLANADYHLSLLVIILLIQINNLNYVLMLTRVTYLLILIVKIL